MWWVWGGGWSGNVHYVKAMKACETYVRGRGIHLLREILVHFMISTVNQNKEWKELINIL